MLNLSCRRLRARFTLLAVVALSALLLRSVAFAQTSVSSASRNLRPNPLATALQTSDLPEPDTPVRTIATAFPGGESIVVIL